MKQFVCSNCGSDDVRRDAWAIWNPHSGNWEAAELCDNAYCNACDGETRLKEVDITLTASTLPVPTSKGHALAMIFNVAGPHEGKVFSDLPRAERHRIVDVWNKCSTFFDPDEVERSLVHHGRVSLVGYRRIGAVKRVPAPRTPSATSYAPGQNL